MSAVAGIVGCAVAGGGVGMLAGVLIACRDDDQHVVGAVIDSYLNAGVGAVAGGLVGVVVGAVLLT